MRNRIIVSIICIIVVVLSLHDRVLAEKQLDNIYYVIENEWKNRDGENVAIIHSAIVELTILAPDETLKWLSEKEKIQQELLTKWQFNVFTDYTGKAEENLKNLKATLIKTLEKCNSKDKNIGELRKRMLHELKLIKIRKID
jgi:hypothetical protein